MTKEDALKKVAGLLKNNPLVFFDFLFYNNLNGILDSLKSLSLTTESIPQAEKLAPILVKLVKGADQAQLKSFVDNFKFDPNANNFTTNPILWELLGLHEGDVKGLYNKIYS